MVDTHPNATSPFHASTAAAESVKQNDRTSRVGHCQPNCKHFSYCPERYCMGCSITSYYMACKVDHCARCGGTGRLAHVDGTTWLPPSVHHQATLYKALCTCLACEMFNDSGWTSTKPCWVGSGSLISLKALYPFVQGFRINRVVPMWPDRLSWWNPALGMQQATLFFVARSS